METSKPKFSIKNNVDVIMAFVVLAVVFMIIIPLPAKLLDVLIALNITISVVIILLTMFTTEVLQYFQHFY